MWSNLNGDRGERTILAQNTKWNAGKARMNFFLFTNYFRAGDTRTAFSKSVKYGWVGHIGGSWIWVADFGEIAIERRMQDIKHPHLQEQFKIDVIINIQNVYMP